MSGPIPYAHAARALLRNSLLDALVDLLGEKDWSAVTMTDVARRAGVSRQSLYNEFGSRQGLIEGYVLRLVDQLALSTNAALNANAGNVYATLYSGFQKFFVAIADDPVLASLLSGEAHVELMRAVTVRSGNMRSRASRLLNQAIANSCIDATAQTLDILTPAIARLAISYMATPPESAHSAAEQLAQLLTPFVETARAGNA